MSTAIEWTDETWNPTVGCSHVSPGCDSCYAARESAGRLSGVPVYAGLATKEPGKPAVFTGEVRCLPGRLDKPLRWKRPRRVFVDSMSDLFHPEVLKATHEDRFGTTWPFLAEVFAVMIRCPQHTFQILTKRPPVMAAVLNNPHFRLDVNAILLREGHDVMAGGMTDPNFAWPRHIWIGTSIESDEYAWRANHLRSVNAVRFLSCEPLLGPLPSLELTGIDWVIGGGESGGYARPTAPEWARALRDRCADAAVPFLWKQWGNWVPYEPDPQPPFWDGQNGEMIDGHWLPADLSENGQPCRKDGRTWLAPMWTEDVIFERVHKHVAGRLLDGELHDNYPEVA